MYKRQVGGEWKDVFEYEVHVDMDKVQSASMVQFDMGEPVEVMVKKNNGLKMCIRDRNNITGLLLHSLLSICMTKGRESWS